MANFPFEANPAFAKLGDDARKNVTQAFDAMSTWRTELAGMSEKNSNAVFDKMAEAAKSLGWPTDFVELSRKHLQNSSKLQLQVVDQVMDLWEKQLTALGKPGEIPGIPGFPQFTGGGTGFPGLPDFASGNMANPMQFWLQAADMWQKGWQQAISTWSDAQQNAFNSADKTRR